MTAVEWLVDQMRQRKEQGLTLSFYDLEMFAEKAKEMEKEQRERDFKAGNDSACMEHEDIKDYFDKYIKSE